VACPANKDNGIAKFTIFGSTSVDVTQINQDSLLLEGQKVINPATDCSQSDVDNDGFPDLSCSVPTCPILGPNLAAEQPKKNGSATIEVTGFLKTMSLNLAPTRIEGEDTVKTSGQ